MGMFICHPCWRAVWTSYFPNRAAQVGAFIHLCKVKLQKKTPKWQPTAFLQLSCSLQADNHQGRQLGWGSRARSKNRWHPPSSLQASWDLSENTLQLVVGIAGIGGSRLGSVGHSHSHKGNKPPSADYLCLFAQHHQGTTGLARRGLLRKRLRTSARQNRCNSATQQRLRLPTWWLDPWCLRQSRRSSLRRSHHRTPSWRQIRLSCKGPVSHGPIGSSVQRKRLPLHVLLCSDGSAFRVPWIPHPVLHWKPRHLCRLPSSCEIPNALRGIFALVRCWCRIHLHPFWQRSFPRLVTLVQGLTNFGTHHGVVLHATRGVQSRRSEVWLWRSVLNQRAKKRNVPRLWETTERKR